MSNNSDPDAQSPDQRHRPIAASRDLGMWLNKGDKRIEDDLGSFTTISWLQLSPSYPSLLQQSSSLQMPLFTQRNCATELKVHTPVTMPCTKDTTVYFLQLPVKTVGNKIWIKSIMVLKCTLKRQEITDLRS